MYWYGDYIPFDAPSVGKCYAFRSPCTYLFSLVQLLIVWPGRYCLFCAVVYIYLSLYCLQLLFIYFSRSCLPLLFMSRYRLSLLFIYSIRYGLSLLFIYSNPLITLHCYLLDPLSSYFVVY